MRPFLGEQGEKSAVITKNSQRETSDWQSSMLRHTGGVELTSFFGGFLIFWGFKFLLIKLVNCDATEIGKLTNGVKVSFTGTTINGQTQELGTTGDTGTAIVVSAANGSLVSFDGTAGSATKVKEGDNTLRYST